MSRQELDDNYDYDELDFDDDPELCRYEQPEGLVEAIGPQVIIDGKRPQAVLSPETGDYLRCIGYLAVAKQSGPKRGTGTLVAAEGGYGILTCAHVVYDHDASHVVDGAAFYPARSDEHKPYGEIRVARGQIRIPDGYRDAADKETRRRYDYAIIRLDGDIDPTLRPIAKLRRSELRELRRVQVAGYSNEAPPKPQRSMYFSQGEVDRDASTGSPLLYYKASTLPGASGSAVCRAFDNGAAELDFITGVHTGGSDTDQLNRGVYLTDDIIDWIGDQIRRS